MPPKRRSAGVRAPTSRQSSQAQSTLSFHGKQNRVTKPGAAQQTKPTNKDPAVDEEVVRTDIKAEADPDLSEPTTAEAAIQQQVEEEVDALEDPLDSKASVKREDVLGGRAPESQVGAVGGKGSGWKADEEEQARKITDTAIKRYWRQKENERLAPRVHQEDLTVYEKVLREWDMSGQYGVNFHVRGDVPGKDTDNLCSHALVLHDSSDGNERTCWG